MTNEAKLYNINCPVTGKDYGCCSECKYAVMDGDSVKECKHPDYVEVKDNN